MTPPQPAAGPRAGSLAWLLSLLLHAVGVGGGAMVVARVTSSPEAAPRMRVEAASVPVDTEYEIDLPVMAEVTSLVSPRQARPDDPATEPHPSGGQPTPRPDMDTRGRGGTDEVERQALNLADHDDAIDLTKDPLSRLDRSQVQRLKVSDDRASEEDRRATWKPMELTFLATGKGKRQERRAIAETDPSRGARDAGAPGVLGGEPGARPLPAGQNEAPRAPGNAVAGGDRASPGRGVLRGASGADHRDSADVALGRPMVTEGRPAVPANAVGKPRDNTDSQQEVGPSPSSLLHASTMGGKPGAGVGGEQGPGKPGAGGEQGAGASARPQGQGAAGPVDMDGADPRASDYLRQVLARLRPLWQNAFPTKAALEGRQGRAIIGFTVLADGRVTGIFVVRRSGVPEFDENLKRAVARASFAPLPANLNARSMRFAISFDAQNPAIR